MSYNTSKNNEKITQEEEPNSFKIIFKNKSMINIKKENSKEDKLSSLVLLSNILQEINQIIKNNTSKESYQSLIKKLNNVFSKIEIIIKDLNNQLNAYKNMLLFNEAKIRKLQGEIFTENLHKEVMQNNINILLQKGKNYELIKEKTGIYVSDGKVINTNRQENEILILRTENSTLKNVIDEYKTKLDDVEKEYKRQNNALIQDKNSLLIKLYNLNQKFFHNQESNYHRYSIAKQKLANNNKKKNSMDFSGTFTNETIDIFNYPNAYKTNDNLYSVDYSNRSKFSDKTNNTLSDRQVYSFNQSFGKKIKLSSFHKNKRPLLNKNEINNLINNSRGKNQSKLRIVRNENNSSKNNDKINIIDSNKIKKDNNISKTERINSKGCIYDFPTSNPENKKKKCINSYSKNNIQKKRIIHKKNNSYKCKNIPFKNSINFSASNNKDNNKENDKNANNSINIRNLILNREQMIKSKRIKKINMIYKSLISNTNNNNDKNQHINGNMRNINLTKIPTPKSFIKN